MKRRRSNPQSQTRTGITLLEVVIALAILGAGVLSLRTASSIGQRATMIAIQQREGIRRARMVLDETVAGIRNLNSHSAAFQDDPNWIYQLSAETEDHGLAHVTVSVRRKHNQGPVVVLDRWVAQHGESP